MSVQVTQGAAEAFFLLAIGAGLLVLQIGVTLIGRRIASNYPNAQLPRSHKYGFGAVWVISVMGLVGAYYIASNHWEGRSIGVGVPSLIAIVSTGATFIANMAAMACSLIDSKIGPKTQE